MDAIDLETEAKHTFQLQSVCDIQVSMFGHAANRIFHWIKFVCSIVKFDNSCSVEFELQCG